jgi:DNA-binding transcriptional LysR family regulator
MNFELKDIEALKSIDEFGSINSAAEKIYISKSTLSERIKKFELELGFKLLERESYKVKLTRQAKFLLNNAAQLVNAHNDLAKMAKLIKNNVEVLFEIGISIIYPTEKSIKLLKVLTKKFPNTQFNFFRETLSGEKMLKNKVIDLSISETINDDANLDFKKISVSKMDLLISADHDFLKLPKDQQNIDNLKKLPQIVIKSTLSEDLNKGFVYDDSPKMIVYDDLSKSELILNSIGWGRLPQDISQRYISSNQLVHLKDIEASKVVNIYLAKRKSHPESKIMQFIWEYFAHSN